MKADFLDDMVREIDDIAVGNEVAVQFTGCDCGIHFTLANTARCDSRQKAK